MHISEESKEAEPTVNGLIRGEVIKERGAA